MRIFLQRPIKENHIEEFLVTLKSYSLKVVYAMGLNSEKFSDILDSDCLFNDYFSQVKGDLSTLNKRVERELPSPNLLEKLKDCERLFYPMIERMNFQNHRNSRLYDFYIKYLIYWLSLIEYLKPDGIVFMAIPHEGHDFVLYHLAKELGLKVIIVERTIFHDRSLILPGIDEFPIFPKSYQNKVEISAEFHTAYQAYQDRIIRVEKKNKKKVFKALIKSVKHIFSKKAVLDAIYGLSDQLPNIAMHTWNRYKAVQHANNLSKLYCDNSVTPDFNKYKGIYFALHFEPEKSTLPMGSKFWNQLYVLETILEFLPEGWVIYVKEHPRQFNRTPLKLEFSRDEQFYLKLINNPRIVLLSLDLKSDTIVNNVQAVGTITGTVGWEAALEKIPTIVFGKPWYYGCPEIFFAHDNSDYISDFFNQLSEGKIQIDLERLKCYATWLKKEATYQGTGFQWIYSEMTEEENEKVLAESISQGFKDLYKN